MARARRIVQTARGEAGEPFARAQGLDRSYVAGGQWGAAQAPSASPPSAMVQTFIGILP